VLFRADSSLEIGSGHVQRCLALAAVLSAKGASSTFVARDLSGNANALIRAAGHSIITLPPRASDPETDAAETSHAIAGLGQVDLVVVDHYALDRRWEDAFKPFAQRCAVIDDLANRPHRCDVLIDVTQAEDRPPPSFAEYRYPLERARDFTRIVSGRFGDRPGYGFIL